MKKEYFIGIDMGTSTVGWAAVDTEYHLLRAKGKDLWGIREFDEAKSAAERRTKRISRRRREREVARLGLLKEMFHDEISKVDPGFFERLNESMYHPEEKRVQSKYSLFADKLYSDVDYYKEFPTVFHLRKALIEGTAKKDVRLVYLAIANMFHHRGHFLSAGLSMDGRIESVGEVYKNFAELAFRIEANFDFSLEIDEHELERILSDKNTSRTQKTLQLADFFGVDKKDKATYEVLKAVAGQSFKPYLILNDLELNDEELKKLSFSFKDDVTEPMEKLEASIDPEYMELFYQMKKLHDAGLLSNIMRGQNYLSFARVNEYEKHKEDLRILKDYIGKYLPDHYDEMFREMKDGNYSAYVGSTNDSEKKRRNVKGNKRDDLYDTIKKLLKNGPEHIQKDYILSEIEKETFLPKQLTSANGVIPNQVHATELKAILNAAEKDFEFLREKDETGFSVSEKILKLFTFQIPYYVGPLNGKSSHAWVERSYDEKVYPWNFEKVVDTRKTSEKFIERMVRHCTYLKGERVLPKTSLLYERFMVLNELNNLKVNEEKITVEQKQMIFNDLFLSGTKVTGTRLTNYIIDQGWMDKNSTISGFDGDFKNTMTSYGKLYGIFGEDLKKDSVRKMAEDIIFWGTIYGDDKKFYASVLDEHLSDVLGKKELQRLKGMKFKDWGNLSREFLELSGCSKEDGELLPLIEMMWNTNYNLMELMSERFTYKDELKKRVEETRNHLKDFGIEDLEGMYLSAPVKRMVWQTYLVLKEVTDVIGYAPKRIFVEMTRNDGEKNTRTVSRKKQLEELYKACKKDEFAKELYEELKGTDERSLRQKKLYLYYTQKGICMYTGEVIELSDLMNQNLYDIDHIYPRHFVKDDSIHNNLVLVRKEVNNHKQDRYPIEDSIFYSQKDMWKSLYDQKFITAEKYKRLTSRTPFTEEQMAGFINRQLVETAQGTKALAETMKNLFDSTEIVYVKSGLVADFRHDTKMYKSRLVNDFHHAQDAYLNVVVGNTYHIKFTKDPKNFIHSYLQNTENEKYHMDKVFRYDVSRNGETAWIARGENKTIKTVETVMKRNTPLLTRMNFEAHGAFYDETRYGKDAAKEDTYVPLKTNDERLKDISKYGGFNKAAGAYFFLVEYTEKKKRIRTLEVMPIYLKKKYGYSKEAMELYCKEELGLVDPDVRITKIKYQSLLKINGYLVHLSGKSGNKLVLRNAVSMILDHRWINYSKKLENISEKGYVEKEITAENNVEFYRILTNKMTQSIFAKRPNYMGEKLQKRMEDFVRLNIEDQAKVLLQILNLTKIGTVKADLTTIGESANAGVMTSAKKISECQQFSLIHQSSAGLFETEIDLLTV